MSKDDLFHCAREYVAGLPKLKTTARNKAKTEAVRQRIRDVATRFRSLSYRELGSLLHISNEKHRSFIDEVRAELPQEPIDTTSEDRRRSELYRMSDRLFKLRMNREYPGRLYEDHPAARFEDRGAISIAVDNDTAHYKVDQSHTIPRPITLATVPYKLAA